MLMRVSIGIHKDDIEAAINTYELMSQKFFTHATPTLFRLRVIALVMLNNFS